MPTKVTPVRWTRRGLEVLDQRLLPARESRFVCTTPSQVAEAIRGMALRGAPLIGVAAAYGMALAARKGHKALADAARRLKASRPTAVALAAMVDRLEAAALDVSDGDLAAALEAEARRVEAEDVESGRRMALAGAELLKRGSTVITYCNTGALATAGEGTAFGVIAEAHRQGRVARVYACETRPYLQGARLTMWELGRLGIPCTLLTDNMAAHVMATEKVDAVLVGADRIAANGDTANKIGTYGLAISARHHKVPFYVVAPWPTIDMALRSGKGIPIEERSSEEVTRLAGADIAPKGAKARHPAFDVTPARLIGALVTDRGVFRPPYDLRQGTR